MFMALKKITKPLAKKASNQYKSLKHSGINTINEQVQSTHENLQQQLHEKIGVTQQSIVHNTSSKNNADVIDQIIVDLVNLKKQMKGTNFGSSTFFSPIVNTSKPMKHKISKSGTVSVYTPFESKYTRNMPGRYYIKIYVQKGSNAHRDPRNIHGDSHFEYVLTMPNKRQLYRKRGTGFGCGTPAGCHFGGLASTYEIQGPYAKFGVLPDTNAFSSPYKNATSKAKFGGQSVSKTYLYESPVSFTQTQTPNTLNTVAKVQSAAASFGSRFNRRSRFGCSNTNRFGCGNSHRFGCRSTPRFGSRSRSRFGEEDFDSSTLNTTTATEDVNFGFYGQYKR